ncbi:MAG: type II secretion system minor pseudopilin GspK [Janthinobacterium lividum]
MRRTLAYRSRMPAHRQRGVAIVMALLVVTLSALLVAGLLWRQQVQIRRVENQRLMAQAQWVARGATDWTRLVIRSEGDTSPVTYLGGVWSVPIAETRLSDFLGKIGEARAEQGASTWLSGSIEDAQSRFNLRDLVTSPAPGAIQVDPAALLTLKNLLVSLSLSSELAPRIADQMRSSLLNSAARFATATRGGTVAPANGGRFTDDPGLAAADDLVARPLQLETLDALLDVPGVTPEVLARLAPFVTILPVPTPININTATAEVIAAAQPGMTLSAAQGLVSSRDQIFFLNLGDPRFARFLPPGGTLDVGVFDVTSRFFIVHGHIRHERAEVYRTSLIYRDNIRHSTRIVSVLDE